MNLQEIHQTISHPAVSSDHTTSDSAPFWGKDGFTFGDVLDMVNPLHHLPVVSKFYREQSQDDASEGSRLVGGALFGGLIGGVSGVLASIVNSAIRHETNQDVSEHLLAMADNSLDLHQSSNKRVIEIDDRPDNSELLARTSDNNPFFLQVFQDASDNEFYSDRHLIHNNPQRGKKWGEV